MKVLRFIKIAFLVVFAVALSVVGMANMGCVTVRLLPGGLADAAGLSETVGWGVSGWLCGVDTSAAEGLSNQVQLPLVFIIFSSVILGIIVGYVWDWLREHRHRAEAKTQRREAKRLSEEVASLKGRTSEHQDDILALVDDAGASSAR